MFDIFGGGLDGGNIGVFGGIGSSGVFGFGGFDGIGLGGVFGFGSRFYVGFNGNLFFFGN